MAITDYLVRIVVETTPFTYYKETQTDILDATITDPGNPGTPVRDFVVEGREDNIPTATASGLVITANVGSAVVNDQTTITADPTDIKTVQVSVVRNDTTSLLEIVVRSKLTGEYSDFSGVTLVEHIKEFQVVANGTVLTEI